MLTYYVSFGSAEQVVGYGYGYSEDCAPQPSITEYYTDYAEFAHRVEELGFTPPSEAPPRRDN